MVNFVNFLSLAVAATLSYGLFKAVIKPFGRGARIPSSKSRQQEIHDRDYF